ncbi:hypothetical protein OAB63_01940 [Alphaproteobacteria bacterium]|nr:hypothetical protein [Alphaproteobacteria bacterium]
MVKHLILLFIFFSLLLGCETTSITKEDKFNNDKIYIDVVQKKINLDGIIAGPNSKKVKDSVQKWLENNLKTSGYDGELGIQLISINTSEKIIDDSVRIDMSLELNFKITNQALSKKKSKLIKVNEFGELTGSFSLNEKDIEIENIIKRLLQRLSIVVNKEII